MPRIRPQRSEFDGGFQLSRPFSQVLQVQIRPRRVSEIPLAARAHTHIHTHTHTHTYVHALHGKYGSYVNSAKLDRREKERESGIQEGA